MARVFVTEPLPGAALVRLIGAFGAESVVVGGGVSGEECTRAAGDLEAIVTSITDRVDEMLLARMPKLRIVANAIVGLDNIDLGACRARRVVVTNTPGVLTEATADLAFGLLIAAARRMSESERELRSGHIVPFSLTRMLGAQVSGGKLGIVGLGRIGQAMARRARGFGMHVAYTQRTRLAEPLERALGATFLPIDELFAASDFVSIHCPLTDATRHIASRPRIDSMKSTAVLINASRAGCVDEVALIDALASRRLFSAGIDVFDNEPRPSDALLALPNLVITPHIGSADIGTRSAMAELAVENVIRVLRGDVPVTPA